MGNVQSELHSWNDTPEQPWWCLLSLKECGSEE